MKRRVIPLLSILLALLLAAQSALAYDFYLIPDSDTRLLTEEELWEWDYDALGYVLNEFFARYGMPFKRDGKYYPYFTQQDWYCENPSFTYADVRTNLEWTNERLVKTVRNRMKELGTTNPGGMSIEEAIRKRGGRPAGTQGPYNPPRITVPPVQTGLSFTLCSFTQKGINLPVYTGPGDWYFRGGANGHAYCTTSEAVYVCGWDGDWLLVMYDVTVNGNGKRVGYVSRQSLGQAVYAPELTFEDSDYVVTTGCSITDDPFEERRSLAYLSIGTHVIYLAETNGWAYVDVNTGEGEIRGFVPFSCIDVDWNN